MWNKKQEKNDHVMIVALLKYKKTRICVTYDTQSIMYKVCGVFS